MKAFTKVLCVILTVTMLFGLCACGKKDKEGAGKYLCTTMDYGFGEPYEDTDGRYLELRSDGTGTIYYGTSLDISLDGKWKLKGEELTFTTLGVDDKGTLKDGVIVLDYSGVVYTFVLEGSDAAKNIKPAADSDSLAGSFIMCGMYADGEYIDRSELFDEAMFDGNSIEFNSDGTGTLVRNGEDPETFSYSSDAEILFFADGREFFFSYENGIVTVYFDDDTACYSKDGYSFGYVPSAPQGEFSSEFAELYSGDWHGMAECYQCTGNFADRNGSQYEIIARFVFDAYGNCTPYLAIALSGQNEYNFTDLSVSYHSDDGEGEYMPIGGTFMKLDINPDESFVQIDPDDSDRMYVNIMLEDSDGSVYQAFACMRPVGDENWSDDDYPFIPQGGIEFYRGKDLMDIAELFMLDTSLIPTAGDDYYDNDEDSGNSGETAGVIDDMGKGYGKSNAYATGTATLELMRKAYAE